MEKVGIREGLRLVLSLCDGARQLDGVGFNKFDTRIVRSIIDIDWTPSQEKLAYRILRKYRRQLKEFFNIDFDTQVEKPKIEATETKTITKKQGDTRKVIDINGNTLLISFPYNPDLVSLVREFTKRNWNSYERRWEVDIDVFREEDIEILKTLIEKHNFTITDKAHEVINKLLSGNLETDIIQFVGDKFLIRKYYFLPHGVKKELDNITHYDKKTKLTYIVPSPTNCAKLLETIVKYADILKPKQEIVDRLMECVDKSVEAIEKSAKTHSDIKIEGFKLEPYPFQKAGIEFAIEKKGNVLIADEMGLGKTVQAIATVHLLKAFPTLVVCPATLKYNWVNEVEKFTDYKSFVINGSPERNKFKLKDIVNDYHFIIINYDILSKWENEIIECGCFKAVIFDESHYIKNPKAKRTKSAKKIAKNIPHRILLTGTPILNRPVELVSQLEILGIFNKIAKNWYDYVYRYCNAHQTSFGLDVSGASNLDELNEKLRTFCMIRREKKDVLKELPEKIRTPIWIDIDNYKVYKKAENDFIGFMRELLQNVMTQEELIEKLSKLQVGEHLAKLNKLRQLVAEGKVNQAIKWIENFFENNPNKKLVVFAYHKDIQDTLYLELQKKGYNPLKISADMKPEKRQETVKLFQEDNDHKVIVIGIKVGAEGITLTKADTMLFVELYWTPSQLYQCEDRIHRIGQENTVNIYYLLGKDTIDQYMWELVDKKANIFKQLTDKTVADERIAGLTKMIAEMLNID